MFTIHNAVCTNSLDTTVFIIYGKFDMSVGPCLPVKFSESSQWPSLQADLSKDTTFVF